MTAIARIHALKKQAGLSDANYRDLLFGVTGKSTSKDLDETESANVIARLVALTGGRQSAPSKFGAVRASGPFASKLQALWMALHDLGFVRDRRDSAMLAFVKRQTGLDHTRFLRDPADAARAIEALKSMARRVGVEWPKEQDGRESVGVTDLRGEIILAQERVLRGRFAALPMDESGYAVAKSCAEAHLAAIKSAGSSPEKLLAIQTALGKIIRSLPAAPAAKSP